MRASRLLRVPLLAALAILTAVPGAVALADDPRDPTMTPEAIARDRAIIRRLNREQAAYVQQRDARYAQGWRDYAAAHGRRDAQDEEDGYADDRRDYAEARADYAEQRRAYEREMREWRADVAACRAGYYERCER